MPVAPSQTFVTLVSTILRQLMELVFLVLLRTVRHVQLRMFAQNAMPLLD